jgi:hypothetical protein
MSASDFRRDEERALQTYEVAKEALLHCRLSSAWRGFTEAATIYKALQESSKENVVRNGLNAAVCYFMAGESKRAKEILGSAAWKKHWHELSPDEQQGALSLREMCVEALKTTSGYKKEKYLQLRADGNHRAILEMLKSDPYICSSDQEYATQMRDSCRAVGKEAVAQLFQEDLDRMGQWIQSSLLI